jgi:hypothetical protein
MLDFTFRILKARSHVAIIVDEPGRQVLTWMEKFPDRLSALAAAKRCGARNDKVEVWRRNKCIHSEVIGDFTYLANDNVRPSCEHTEAP